MQNIGLQVIVNKKKIAVHTKLVVLDDLSLLKMARAEKKKP